MAGNSGESRDRTKSVSGLNKPPEEPLTEDKSGTMATDFSDHHIKGSDATSAPQLSQSMQGHLGRQLRAVYSKLVHEPTPDKFKKLLDELANSQSQKSQKQDRE